MEFDESKMNKRCLSSHMPSKNKRPLTVRETHSWRKNHEHLDFKKQIDPERISQKTSRKKSKTFRSK